MISFLELNRIESGVQEVEALAFLRPVLVSQWLAALQSPITLQSSMDRNKAFLCVAEWDEVLPEEGSRLSFSLLIFSSPHFRAHMESSLKTSLEFSNFLCRCSAQER